MNGQHLGSMRSPMHLIDDIWYKRNLFNVYCIVVNHEIHSMVIFTKARLQQVSVGLTTF